MKLLSRQSASFLMSAIAALACCANLSHAAEPLAWKFSPGSVLRFQTTAERDTTIDLGPAGKESRHISHVVDMTWTVQEVNDDGSAVLTQRIDRLQLKLTSPKEDDVTFDSADKTEPQGFAAMAAPLVKALLAGEVKVTMTPRGEVTAVEAPEALITALDNSVGKDVMGDLATKKGFENLARNVTLMLPEKLEAGETWSTKLETTNPLLGTLTAETTYKYSGPKEVEGQPYETFASALTMKFADSPAKIEVSDEKSSGEVLFNRAAGRLQSARLEHSMTLTIASEDEELKQTLEQKVETKWLGEN